MSRRKKKKFSLLSFIFTVIFLYIAFQNCLGIYKNCKQLTELKTEFDTVYTDYVSIKKEYDALVEKEEKFQSEEYVEMYARGKFMFSKDDEKVFYLPAKDD